MGRKRKKKEKGKGEGKGKEEDEEKGRKMRRKRKGEGKERRKREEVCAGIAPAHMRARRGAWERVACLHKFVKRCGLIDALF